MVYTILHGIGSTVPRPPGDHVWHMAHDMLTDSWPCLKVHLLDMCASTSQLSELTAVCVCRCLGHAVLSNKSPPALDLKPLRKWKSSRANRLVWLVWLFESDLHINSPFPVPCSSKSLRSIPPSEATQINTNHSWKIDEHWWKLYVDIYSPFGPPKPRHYHTPNDPPCTPWPHHGYQRWVPPTSAIFARNSMASTFTYSGDSWMANWWPSGSGCNWWCLPLVI